MPGTAAQAGDGEDGPARRDGGVRQRDPDNGVIPDRRLRLGQPLPGRLQALGVQLSRLAGAFLRVPLHRAGHDLGDAAGGGQLAALTVPRGLLHLRLPQVAALAPHVGGGRAHGLLGRGLDDQHTGPGLYRVIQPSARVQVQVVGRLVQQDDRRAAQEQGGQRDQHRLATGQLRHGGVESRRAGDADQEHRHHS
jgi:hypothetical protein